MRAKQVEQVRWGDTPGDLDSQIPRCVAPCREETAGLAGLAQLLDLTFCAFVCIKYPTFSLDPASRICFLSNQSKSIL